MNDLFVQNHFYSLPIAGFDFGKEYLDAFQLLRSGTHIGKVVLTINGSIKPSCSFQSEGAVVVTGGLGGLGLLSAKVLADLGIQYIFLVSRSGHVAY